MKNCSHCGKGSNLVAAAAMLAHLTAFFFIVFGVYKAITWLWTIMWN